MAGGWLSWVRANDNQIMALLEDQVDNLVKATSVLAESMSNYGTQIEKNSILKELEHEGDQFTHKVFTTIDKTFITPLDKEDISELTSTIDQVLDATYGTSDRFVLFNRATKRLSAVRWRIGKSIVYAWIITIPASAAVAAVVLLTIKAIF